MKTEITTMVAYAITLTPLLLALACVVLGALNWIKKHEQKSKRGFNDVHS